MSVQNDVVLTLTGPDGTISTINGDSGLSTYVGIVDAEQGLSGFDSADVREAADELSEGDGGIHGSFYYGRRSFTIPVILLPDPSATLNARIDRLNRSTNAMRDDPANGLVSGDGLCKWTETGREETQFLYRRQLPWRVTGRRPKNALCGLVSADAYARGTNLNHQTVTSSNTNVPSSGVLLGATLAAPVVTLTAPTNAITIERVSPAPIAPYTSIVYLDNLSGAGTVTVDFYQRSVTCTTAPLARPSAERFPDSTWWGLVPGVTNIVKITGATCTDGFKWRNAWL